MVFGCNHLVPEGEWHQQGHAKGMGKGMGSKDMCMWPQSFLDRRDIVPMFPKINICLNVPNQDKSHECQWRIKMGCLSYAVGK